MNPVSREIIDGLASEYVLGTLRGPARRRFERWRGSLPEVDERCRYWEEHLVHLAKGLKPVHPPAHLWPAILQRLQLERQQRSSFRSSFRVRTVAAAASVLLVAGLAGLLLWRSLPATRATAVATISAKSGDRIWQVELFSAANRLVMRVEKRPDLPPGRDYELWALPQGGKPVSLGVMPAEGVASHALSRGQREALANSSQVAVTLEPAGGSPDGHPTGAPIFVAPLRASS